MQAYINPFKENNDHTRIMREIGIRSSFKQIFYIAYNLYYFIFLTISNIF